MIRVRVWVYISISIIYRVRIWVDIAISIIFRVMVCVRAKIYG